MQFYFDDEEVGPSKTTSHPEFARLAVHEWYYDCTDDYSPFGNDAGADALANLEDAYREGDDVDLLEFLKALWEDRELKPSLMCVLDPTELAAYLDVKSPSMDWRLMEDADLAIIGAVFGVLKITGSIPASIRDVGLVSISRVLLRRGLRPQAEAKAPVEKNRYEEMAEVLNHAPVT